MSRLIDADKVQLKLYEECQNIRHFYKNREKKQIFADGIDFAWVMLDNTPTVKAIPIEWLYQKRTLYLENKCYMSLMVINEILNWWEKENGRD